MTVQNFIEKHHQMTLHLMTPMGFIDLTPEKSKQLLDGQPLAMNPGCSECNMILPAEIILSQFICRYYSKADHCSMLTSNFPPEEDD